MWHRFYRIGDPETNLYRQSKHSVFHSPHLSRHCHGMQAMDGLAHDA